MLFKAREKNMEKEELLQKSRNENKKGDEYEKKVVTKATSIAFIAMVVVAAVLFYVELIVKGNTNYAIWGTIMVSLGVYYLVLGYKVKKKIDFICGIVITVCAVAMVTIYMIQNM